MKNHPGDPSARTFCPFDPPSRPWVHFTPMWDTGAGENQNFPTKWMSADGQTMYLIFSNNDYFSVRQATLKLR